MATRETPQDRGRRKGRAAHLRFVEQLREARLNLGMSQRAAAEAAGMSRSEWGQVERGGRPVPIERAGLMAAIVSLDLSVGLYASGVALRDDAQVRLLSDLRQVIEPGGWSWRYEVIVGGDPTEQRAWDAALTHPVNKSSIRVDAETRLRDCQDVVRRVSAKRLADGTPRVVLLVRDSRHNREALRKAAEVLRTEFPVSPRAALAALRAGTDPGADALIVLDHQRPADPRAGTA